MKAEWEIRKQLREAREELEKRASVIRKFPNYVGDFDANMRAHAEQEGCVDALAWVLEEKE